MITVEEAIKALVEARADLRRELRMMQHAINGYYAMKGAVDDNSRSTKLRGND